MSPLREGVDLFIIPIQFFPNTEQHTLVPEKQKVQILELSREKCSFRV